MRSLSTTQLTALASAGRDVHWFVRFAFPSPVGSKYYSIRASTNNFSVDMDPLLTKLPSVARNIALDLVDSLQLGTDSLALTNVVDGENQTELDTILEILATIQGVEVTLFMAFETGAAIAESDWIQLQRWRVEDYSIGEGLVTFNLADWITKPCETEIGWTLSQTDDEDIPSANTGLMAPLVWGTIDGCPAYLLTRGARANLADGIEEDDVTIELDDASALASSGSVWIDNEEIAYTGNDITCLTGCSRHQNGTSAASHSSGVEVKQVLSSYRFLVAGQSGLTLTNITLNDRKLSSGEYVAGDTTYQGETISYVDVLPTAFPITNETAETATEVDPDDHLSWSTSSTGDVTDEANAIDTGSTRETSAAILKTNTAGSTALTATVDDENLSARSTEIAKVKAFARFAVKTNVSSGIAGWPTTPPTMQVFKGATDVGDAVALPQPDDSDFTTDLQSLTATATTAVSLTAAGEEFDVSTILYVSGSGFKYYDNVTDVASGVVPTNGHEISISNYSEQGSSGDELVIETDVTVPSAYGSYMESGSSLISNTLKFMPDDDAVTTEGSIQKIKASVTVKKSSGGLDTIIYCTLKRSTIEDAQSVTLTDQDEEYTFELEIENEAGWTAAQAEDAYIVIYSEVEYETGTDPSLVSGVIAGVCYDITEVSMTTVDVVYAGATTLVSLSGLDGVSVASQKYQVTIDITDVVAAAGWDWFDPTDDAPAIKITYGDDDDDAVFYIYEVGFIVKESSTSIDIPDPDDWELTSTIAGAAPSGDPQATIESILGLMGLSSSDYGAASLASALAGAQSDYPDWTVARWLGTVTTLGDLLSSLVNDCGIRHTWESGLLLFYAAVGIGLETGVDDECAAFDDDDLLGLPTFEHGDQSLVVNKLTVEYNRECGSGESCQSTVIVQDTGSQALPWGLKTLTHTAEWVRDSTTAEALAARKITDHTAKILLAQAELTLNQLPIELADMASVSSMGNGGRSMLGRVCGASMTPSSVVLKIAAPNNRVFAVYEDALNYIEVRPATNTVIFVLGGTMVAIMTESGVRIAGSLVEIDRAANETQTDAVEYNSARGSWAFAIRRADDDIRRIMEVLPNGNLECSSLVEITNTIRYWPYPYYSSDGYFLFGKTPNVSVPTSSDAPYTYHSLRSPTVFTTGTIVTGSYKLRLAELNQWDDENGITQSEFRIYGRFIENAF